ncbi:uncharacterized protein AB9W97_019447 isoform 3-T3 [Spinachia spinachia]
MASSTSSTGVLPTGGRIFISVPDVFFIPEFDAAVHFLAVVFYLSAAVELASVTLGLGQLASITSGNPTIYRLDIAAVVGRARDVLRGHASLLPARHLLRHPMEEVLKARFFSLINVDESGLWETIVRII